MDNGTLVQPSSFCWNTRCPAYGQVDLANIRKFGRTLAGVQRYQCRVCQRTFVETIGTVFYGRRQRWRPTAKATIELPWSIRGGWFPRIRAVADRRRANSHSPTGSMCRLSKNARATV